MNMPGFTAEAYHNESCANRKIGKSNPVIPQFIAEFGRCYRDCRGKGGGIFGCILQCAPEILAPPTPPGPIA